MLAAAVILKFVEKLRMRVQIRKKCGRPIYKAVNNIILAVHEIQAMVRRRIRATSREFVLGRNDEKQKQLDRVHRNSKLKF